MFSAILPYLPKSSSQYYSAKNGIDFDQLEKEPSKLLQFYLRVRELSFPNRLENELFKGILVKLQESVLSRSDLSSYHKLKLLTHCPELICGREEELQERALEFAKKFHKDPANPKMITRASKISKMLSENPALRELTGDASHQIFNTSDGQPIVIDVHGWARCAPRWQQILIKSPPNYQLNISGETFSMIDRYIREGSLPKLSTSALVTIHVKAGELGYKKLQKVCGESLMSCMIEEGNVLQILECALRDRNEPLIQACIRFFNIVRTDVQLSWNVKEGLEVKIIDLDKEKNSLSSILQSLLKIDGVILSNPKSIEHVITKGIQFPTASRLTLESDLDSSKFDPLRSSFPNVKKCVMPQQFYEKLTPEFISKWQELERLTVTREEKLDGSTAYSDWLFPKLKVFTQDYVKDKDAALLE